MNSTPIAVVTTLGSMDAARALARDLVERRLAACAQLENVDSIYRWKGEVQQEPEVRVVLKTTRARYDALEAAILAAHPYELPAVHAYPIERVHGPYAAWIDESTAG